MAPEQPLVEFISTSAAFQGSILRSLEWDQLKVWFFYICLVYWYRWNWEVKSFLKFAF